MRGSRSNLCYPQLSSFRLVRKDVAIDLVGEIAQRAGVTTRTFFRHFPDKREVLFAGADALRSALVEKILLAPETAEPLRLIIDVLASFDWEGLGPRAIQRQRQAVIAANPELLERDLSKHHGIVVAFTDALLRRGVDGDRARLAARVATLVFFTAYGQWLETDDSADLATISESVMSLLATIVPAELVAR